MKLLPFIFLFITSGISAQFIAINDQYARSIEANAMKEHVFILASKEFQGRETGTEGNKKAADYIAGRFASFGIPPVPGDGDFFQEVTFSSIKWKEINLTVSSDSVKHLTDYLSIPQYIPVQSGPIEINSMTFLGYGIDDPVYSDYAGVDVRGKHLLIYGGEPRNQNGQFRITGTDSTSEWSTDLLIKLAAAKKAGAASVWIIEEKFRDLVLYARRNLINGSMLMGSAEQLTDYPPHAVITSGLGQKLAGTKINKIIKLRNKITKTGRPAHLTIPAAIQWTIVHDITTMKGANVLGYIKGTDPALSNEVVVLTAHYDHLGIRGESIFFGADDNASGTSAVLEIARAFAKAKAEGHGPRRSVLCMLMTGEEKGLLGSKYYTEYPVFPLEETVADINIDMIGRVDTMHADPNYVYVIGSDHLSSELHAINENANQQYTHLNLDYTYNSDDDPNRFYYRSDHYNFAKNGIPIVFFFSGVHEDYHRPSDTPDKILFNRAETIARLAFHTAWELANREERIKVDVIGRN
jgi:hypothetical protein